MKDMFEGVKITSTPVIKTVTNHKTAEQYAGNSQTLQSMPLDEVVERIIALNQGLTEFWRSPSGWAPVEAAQILSKSRLDWQVSLSKALRIWTRSDLDKEEPGHLILAWVNLGSLTEGTLKLFLSVFYETYKDDAEAIYRETKLQSPDGLGLDRLRCFYKKRIWDENWDRWVLHLQHRRNAVHAFKSRDIGSFDELHSDIRRYLRLLRYVNFRLPYPDDLYRPQEIVGIISEEKTVLNRTDV